MASWELLDYEPYVEDQAFTLDEDSNDFKVQAQKLPTNYL